MLKDCIHFAQEADTGGGKSFKTKNDIVFGTPIGATRLHEAESYALLAVSVADHAKIFIFKVSTLWRSDELEARPIDLAFLYVLDRVNFSSDVGLTKFEAGCLLGVEWQKRSDAIA